LASFSARLVKLAFGLGKMEHITIRQGIPDLETYLGLKRAVGWPVPESDAASAALANTRCGFIVQRDDQTLGMATVHGDGVLYFYIQDVIIHPEFQHQGHGTRLMNAVMRHIIKHARDKAYIALFSAKGLEPFYARYGFIARPIDNFGAGMFFIKRGMKSEPAA
jgi:ribosomal protein S18 acetylase RimI-like enzyme